MVSAATFGTYGKDDYSTTDFNYAPIQTDQPDPTTLTTADFNNCGALDAPTLGTDSVLNTSTFVTNNYNTFTLNATGLGWIIVNGWTMLGVRSEEDYVTNGSQPTTDERITVHCSEAAGTGNDPKLIVTFTLPVTGNYAFIM